MNQSQKEKWSLIRQQGAKRFILFHDVLLCGLPFTLMISISDYYPRYGLKLSPLGDYLGHAWFWIIFRCLFFGFFMGLWLWLRMETDFLK